MPSWLVLCLGPLLIAATRMLRRREHEPSSLGKVTAGLLLVGLAYGVMSVAASAVSSGPASPLWLLGCLTLLVLGELLIAPLALALMTRMAPRRLVGLMSGLWCAISAAGYCIAGEVGVLLQRGQSGRSFAILGGVLVLGAACVAAIASISRNKVRDRPRP